MVTFMAGDSLNSRILFVILFMAWLAFGIVGYWAWWPISPAIVVLDEPIPWDKVVRPGGSMTRELRFSITTPIELTVNRRLVEQNCVKCRIYELERSVKSYAVGTYTQSRTLTVPPNVPRGTYRFEADASWQATPLRKGFVELPGYIIDVIPNMDTPVQPPKVSWRRYVKFA